MPEAADRQHDQAWVELVEALGREAEPVEDPGAEVLDEHVGPLRQPGEDVAAVVGLQVEDDRLLVAVRGEEVGRDVRVVGADEGRAPAAGVVTGVGLDLDDARAHVAEHLAGLRSGQGTRQVDDEDAGQGCTHGATLPAGAHPSLGTPCRTEWYAVGAARQHAALPRLALHKRSRTCASAAVRRSRTHWQRNRRRARHTRAPGRRRGRPRRGRSAATHGARRRRRCR